MTGLETVAIIVSTISAVYSMINARRTFNVSERQLKEQKEQFEENIRKQEEQFEKTIKESKEIERIKERPYIIVQSYEADSKTKSLKIIFKNKGNGIAFCVAPDYESFGKDVSGKNICLRRCDPIDDAIMMVGESLDTNWKVEMEEDGEGELMIAYKDASDRSYRQKYYMTISKALDISVRNYAVPELIEN